MKTGEVNPVTECGSRIAGVITKIRRPSQQETVMSVIAFLLFSFL